MCLSTVKVGLGSAGQFGNGIRYSGNPREHSWKLPWEQPTQWQENRQAEEIMLVFPACAEEESMDIQRLPYSEGLILTQDTQHLEHPFQLQEALALLVPGEALIIRLGEEEQYHDVRSLVEQLAKTVGIDHLEFGKVGERDIFVGIPPANKPDSLPAPDEKEPEVMEHRG
jgi:hypothetical protein